MLEGIYKGKVSSGDTLIVNIGDNGIYIIKDYRLIKATNNLHQGERVKYEIVQEGKDQVLTKIESLNQPSTPSQQQTTHTGKPAATTPQPPKQEETPKRYPRVVSIKWKENDLEYTVSKSCKDESEVIDLNRQVDKCANVTFGTA